MHEFDGLGIQRGNAHPILIAESSVKMASDSKGDYILMQSTGLLDKNGKEIYSDDLVRCIYQGSFDQHNRVGVVEWDKNNAQFGILFPDKGVWIEFGSEDIVEMEIVGNEHENPSLLPK